MDSPDLFLKTSETRGKLSLNKLQQSPGSPQLQIKVAQPSTLRPDRGRGMLYTGSNFISLISIVVYFYHKIACM